MANRISQLIRYQCSRCMDVHKHEYDAEDCCAPEVYEVQVCPVCDEVFDTEAEALACCDSDANALNIPTPLELEAAGQLRLLP